MKQALKGVPVTSTNFSVAWDKLKRRYDNNRGRLYVHLESLINLSQVSSELAKQISGLVDTVVHLLVRKLDSFTKKDWAIHEKKVEGLSTYANLLKFLEDRINSLSDPFEVQPCVELPPTPASSKNVQNKQNKPRHLKINKRSPCARC